MAKQDPPTEVTPGLRFRKVVGDEKVLWEAVEPLAKGFWLCRVINEPWTIDGETVDSDFDGLEDAFREDAILRQLKVAALFGGYDPANYEPLTRAFGGESA